MRTRLGRWAVVSVVAASLAMAVAPARGAVSTGASARRVVAERVPILGGAAAGARELAAVRSQGTVGKRETATAVASPASGWTLEASIPGAVIHDVAFANPRVGYVAAELGQVWKTTDGGRTWTEVLNVGFPSYWYGVAVLGPANVVVSGFNDQNFTGVIRWSHDGGTTWSSDVIVTTDGWANRVRFQGAQDGLVNSIVSLDNPNEAQFTTTGGGTSSDWTTVVPDPNGGWFGADFAFLPDLSAYLSGITECASRDGGATWACGPSVDAVFDGAVAFVDHRNGWVAGGEISPNVEGWVHRTTDGGRTWSDRTLDSPWPIRQLEFLSTTIGWAAGGNVYSGVGGMYLTRDGGQTWQLDANTGAEMGSCTHLDLGTRTRVWCVGTTSAFSGVVYTAVVPTP